MKYVTNIFPILNLRELSSQYRIYNMKGLRKTQKDYQKNKQWLIDKFSRELRHPVLIIEINEEPKLVVKNDPEILSRISVENDFGRIYLHLYLTEEVFEIDFQSPSKEVKQICTRFLQFDLNGELKRNKKLWQPYTGGPFFLKEFEIREGVAIFKGFTFRIISLPQGGFGVVIDATRKFISARPVDCYITREEFTNRYRSSKEFKSFLYKYVDWYEIQPTECDDFNVSEFPVNGISLIEHVRKVIPKPHPEDLANLPNDSSVLTYYSHGETRGVPAGLLYEVLDFQDTNNGEINKLSIIPPDERFGEIKKYKWDYFYQLRFGKTSLKLSNKTIEIPENILSFPDFELGNNTILYAKDYKSPKELVRTRMNKLLDSAVGFYTKSPLPNQILIFPRSINDTSGELLIKMLKESMSNMYPADKYLPDLIPYEDKFKKGTDYLAIGKHIVNAVKEGYKKTGKGYGVVMIPRLQKKSKREHDKLSALLVSELAKLNIKCSIIHTDTVNLCIEAKRNRDGSLYYAIKPDHKDRYFKKLSGYLRNVGITKVLLNSYKWPFVLHQPLIADLTIGIDVKHHTAGFVIIDKYGKNIRTLTFESEDKEKLSSGQLEAILYQIVKEEIEIDPSIDLRKIVIHRDGRLFDLEHDDLFKALKKLKDEGKVSPEASINIIEIPKTSFISVRLFGLRWDDRQNQMVAENPPNGLYYNLGDECFVCTTGKEFGHDGTSNPLYAKFIWSNMTQAEILNDLFKLTTLAFTKPDDCSRVPLTIKINDMALSDAASEYDEDGYRKVQLLLEELNITTNE